MEKWSEIKKTGKVISDVEAKIIERTADFVDELIERRESLGWTQDLLANAAGLKQPAVARIEKLGNVPKFDTLLKLVLAMGMNIKLVTKEE